MAAVVVKNVTINYRVGDFRDIGIKEFFMRKITKSYYEKSFVAVDDVSFSLEKGDILGIVGVNGAGKSTLLKAISGIMRPTSGEISVRGRIASLLELSTGFDKDLTVKENAYLRGAILQFTRAFMETHYEEIIDFAELKAFEDRPFRQLSTGMKSRLAFSVSSMMNPDILILDEVLSVGDGAFRKKSQAKMKELMNGGTITIIVSHSLEQITDICNKALWLDHGKVMDFGDCKEVCAKYKSFLAKKK